MGFDLEPRNKKIDQFHFGAFSWSWMMNAGVGLVLGYSPSKQPAEFTYIPDKKGRCPSYNDGYYVSADLAWAMAQAAIGLTVGQRRINKEWAELEPEEREKQKERNEKLRIYKMPVREDFIEIVEKFAVWAQISRGFGIF